MRSARAEIAVLVALALVAAGAIAGCGGGGADDATAEAQATAPEPGSIALDDLERCKDPKLPGQLRCGRIDLPYERADPSLGTISVRYAVRPRNDRSRPSEGAIIAIEGGPGYGSVASARGYIVTFGDLLDRRELILVDARGTGASKPIDCPNLQTGRVTGAIGFAECAEKLGDRFDSFRTSAIADDIDDVRTALGYDDVEVYGDSYGTFLAQSYAFRHPEGLEALVLDSAYPVRGESPWYPSTWRTGIRGLTIACDRSPGCDGDAGERLARFVEKLRGEGIDVGPFLGDLASAGYSPPGSYLRLDRVISAYLAGDTEPYEELTKRGKATFGNPDNYSHGQELVVSCNDYPMIWNKDATWEERRAELSQAAREYPKDAFAPFTPTEIALSSDWGYLECLGAPQPGPLYEPAAADDLEAPDVPVLVVAGELDNVTSPAEGRATAELFPNSELFVWPDAGHVYALYDPDNRGAKKIRKFLRENG